MVRVPEPVSVPVHGTTPGRESDPPTGPPEEVGPAKSNS